MGRAGRQAPRSPRPMRLPLLEPGAAPRRAAWYALAPRGDGPCARVGHGCCYWARPEARGVVVVGGADPANSFSDARLLELGALRWAPPRWTGLLARYEHATFVPAGRPRSLWVFGGADQAGNRSSVQVLNAELGTWESPEVTGTRPLPRTFHSSSAVVGDCLYVFGGGDKGAEPVKDQRLHVFDTVTLTWSQPEVHGDPPASRQGHAVVAVGSRLFLHGGLAGEKFYDDLFCLDTSDMKWEKVPATGDVPGGRAAHSAAAFKDHFYIFGGVDPTGALDTMYRYHIEKQHWTLLEFDSPVPPGRLDHSMCIIPWQVCNSVENNVSEAATNRDKSEKEAAVTVAEEGDPSQNKQSGKGNVEDTLVHLFFVFGGMDTQGEIYRDCLVCLVE
ncbi:rab9 effector protein with kelch motifs [Alligator mississippiensis]|uniref:rab9 effector protein with kelch motifs n=1 Tax=Alligator mississippiensis TaxID=8496 RepID=UPI0009075D45|nr:rab9 effector protein with kelch motifs [Alligator mississippiensis]